MGVNIAVNAALGAARILASWDDGLRLKVEGYVDNAASESLENDRKLQLEEAS